MLCKLGIMLIIPNSKKEEYISIGKHMHAKGQEIPIPWFFPNAYFGLLYHTSYYTLSSACFVGVGNPYYHGSWSRNLHVFLHTRGIQNNNSIQNSCMKGPPYLGPKSSVSPILAKPSIGHPPLSFSPNRTKE